MKKLIFVVGFFFLFGNGFSQSGWFLQYYSPTFVNYNNNMFFIDSLTGLYSRQYYSSQGLFKTINGGNNWNILDSNINYITSIFFINQNTGWMSAGDNNTGGGYDHGKIYKSTNAGLNWVTQVIPVYVVESPYNDRNISSIKFINANTGYASGFIKYLSGQALLIDTYVLKTINGGTNWTVSLRIMTGDMVDDPPFFRKLDFADENNVWVTGFKGIFYHTSNGGANWNSTAINMGGNNTDLKLINQNTGYVFCSYNWQFPNWSRLVLKSTNGGYNFSAVYSSNTLKLNSFYFTDINNGWICGDSNIILRTTNGGLSWVTQNSPIFANYKRVYFYNTNTGWISDDTGHILKTTTGGMTFIKNVNQNIPDKYILLQNYPNPFNPSTIIKFQIKDSRMVTLKVYDIPGKEMATLVNEKLKPGEYQVTFNGNEQPSEIYFYVLTCGDFMETKKMVLLK